MFELHVGIPWESHCSPASTQQLYGVTLAHSDTHCYVQMSCGRAMISYLLWLVMRLYVVMVVKWIRVVTPYCVLCRTTPIHIHLPKSSSSYSLSRDSSLSSSSPTSSRPSSPSSSSFFIGFLFHSWGRLWGRLCWLVEPVETAWLSGWVLFSVVMLRLPSSSELKL